MSTARKISILLVLVGVLFPVASLGFVGSYHPATGFIWNLTEMDMVLKEGRIVFPYKYIFALGCLIVGLGGAGVLFSPNQPPEAPAKEVKKGPNPIFGLRSVFRYLLFIILIFVLYVLLV